MATTSVYIDLRGRSHSLADLDPEELELVSVLQERARTHPDWNDFDNFWFQTVSQFYDARGLPRSESCRKVVFRIAQDLSGRIGIAAGHIRPPDYRSELEELMRTRFPTRREFCEATGLSEEELAQVLARRKHLPMEVLAQALDRIGYTVRIAPHVVDGVQPQNGVVTPAAI